MSPFLVIAITPPYFFSEEAEKINSILSEDRARFVHIRKPGADKDEIKSLLSNINPDFHKRLKLHDHFSLIDNYDLGGIHLNSRNPIPYPGAKSISISFHSLEEIDNKDNYDYFFLSPIFDSISKSGYKATFDLDKLPQIIKGRKAIALGGVTPEKFSLLKSLGFQGAALLGHFFPNKRNSS